MKDKSLNDLSHDVTHPEQRELCGGVALVVGAVALALLTGLSGPGGRQSVVSNNPEM